MIRTKENELVIRLAKSGDIKNIVSLVNRAYRGDSGRKGWTTESDILDGQRVDDEILKEILSQNESAILIAETPQAQLLGCVHIQRVNAQESYLGMLTVDPNLQKSGVGSVLLGSAENFAQKEWQSEVIAMTVISLRTELIQWYQRKGYQLTGEKKPFPYGDQRFGIPLRDDLEFLVLKKSQFSQSTSF